MAKQRIGVIKEQAKRLMDVCEEVSTIRSILSRITDMHHEHDEALKLMFDGFCLVWSWTTSESNARLDDILFRIQHADSKGQLASAMSALYLLRMELDTMKVAMSLCIYKKLALFNPEKRMDLVFKEIDRLLERQ